MDLIIFILSILLQTHTKFNHQLLYQIKNITLILIPKHQINVFYFNTFLIFFLILFFILILIIIIN